MLNASQVHNISVLNWLVRTHFHCEKRTSMHVCIANFSTLLHLVPVDFGKCQAQLLAGFRSLHRLYLEYVLLALCFSFHQVYLI